MISFLVPVYNEAANLPELLTSLSEWARETGEDCRLLAVDDGSTDGSAELLRAFHDIPVTVIQHCPELGGGGVFQSGFRAWADVPAHANDLVVTLEADNTSS